ncbi:Cof-type HAD-IIB family hydrolase [Peribacillus acanthi]|uniref:Cof-type HAD-IIB family hydrolase n=1 Tax=Peribacillus acanthi TaxID=2171554 RepID=UPI000D3EA491|nr:Cof-type HAD-IIB family hydrolase [Peribacillus acanthi]
MIKCIAIDMDGTLLNSKQKISAENKEAILKAQEQGIEVVVATGRSYIEAIHVIEEAQIISPIISINGAVVMDKEGQKVVSNPINPDGVKLAIHVLENHGIYYEIYTSDGIYSNDKDRSIATIVDVFCTANPQLDPMEVTELARNRFEIGHVKEVESYSRLMEDDSLEFYKLLVFSADLERLGEAGGRLKRIDGLAITSSGRENLEINSMDAQKGIALEKFVREKGIALSETMALGDNFNDVSMFERVGLAVAMGNAPSEIQKICHEVTDTNENNGVANAILKVIGESTP